MSRSLTRNAAKNRSAAPLPVAAVSLPRSESCGLLRRLGIFGFDRLEPVVLAALASEATLLLVGAHGTAKSLLLERLSEGLELEWRHYNASLLNYDDLVGYPLPDAEGKLSFVQTPASIWDAEAVFLDEISRCRADMQNRVFPIIHERCVQGIRLEKLRFRWAAMNPPPPADDPDTGLYRGSEPLDAALADRFAFVLEVPDWNALGDADRLAIVRVRHDAVDASVGAELRRTVARIAAATSEVELALAEGLAEYVCLVTGLLAQARIKLSARRANTLFRNAASVIAAARVLDPEVRVEDALYLALSCSLPQPAEGIAVDPQVVLTAHRTAAAAVSTHTDALRRRLLSELSPVRRVVLAAKEKGLPAAEFTAYVADGLADAPPGGRHALAVHLFESGSAGRLSAAVAEQAADLYKQAVMAQNARESVATGSLRQLVWKKVTELLGSLPESERDTDLVGNVLTALFVSKDLTDVESPTRVLEAWNDVRRICRQVVV